MERTREDPDLTIQRLFDEATLRVIRKEGGPISPDNLIAKVTPLVDEAYKSWRGQQKFLLLGPQPGELTRRAVWELVDKGLVSFTPEHKVILGECL